MTKAGLRITLQTFLWALLLLMVYALTTRAQSHTTLNQPLTKKSSAAPTAGSAPTLPVQPGLG